MGRNARKRKLDREAQRTVVQPAPTALKQIRQLPQGVATVQTPEDITKYIKGQSVIAFVQDAFDCCSDKYIIEYASLFKQDNHACIMIIGDKYEDLLNYLCRQVVLFRSGYKSMPQESARALLTYIVRLKTLGVRVVYYVDDLLFFFNENIPVVLMQQCDAIIVTNQYLKDALRNMAKVDPPIIVVPTHIHLERFDSAPSIPPVPLSSRFRVLLSSSAGIGLKHAEEICAIANEDKELSQDIEWIFNCQGVAQARRAVNRFRNLKKTYIDWISLDEYHSLAKVSNLIIHPAHTSDVSHICTPELEQPWLDSKSEVKYNIAGAARIPIISSPTFAYKEAITDGVTGFLANTAEEFIDKIRELKNDEELCKRIGEAARKDNEERYDVKVRYPLYRDAITTRMFDSKPKKGFHMKSYNVLPDRKAEASIIITSYNYAQYIEETIESCLNQEFDRPYEIIVVDDGSTDNSIELIKKYPVELIALPENTKSWVSVPLNTAFAKSTGKYVVTVASDDSICPDFLSTLVGEFDKDPTVDVVKAGIIEYTPHKVKYIVPPSFSDDPEERKREQLIGSRIYHATLIKRRVWEELGGYRPFFLQDWDFWIRVILAENKIATIDKCIYKYRSHNKSLIHNRGLGKETPGQTESFYQMCKLYKDEIIKRGIKEGEIYRALRARGDVE